MKPIVASPQRNVEEWHKIGQFCPETEKYCTCQSFCLMRKKYKSHEVVSRVATKNAVNSTHPIHFDTKRKCVKLFGNKVYYTAKGSGHYKNILLFSISFQNDGC